MQGNLTENLISPSAADRLIAAHDGDLALLYVFMQRSGSADLERAAGELCRTLSQMQEAYEKLRRMGLAGDGGTAVQQPARRVLPPANELPEYTAEDVVRRSQEDPAFSAVLLEAAAVMGQRLSTPDMRKLFAIYDHLAMPAEVVMLLVHYCAENSMKPDGTGRRPSMRYIENEAYHWADLEILTLEQAEEYIDSSRRRREESARLAAELGIRGRQLSPTEKKYINTWLDMGLSLDIIMLAYDRTVTNTGALRWGYMNKILANWKEKGYSSVSEIEEKESRRKTGSGGRGAKGPVDTSDLDEMFNKL